MNRFDEVARRLKAKSVALSEDMKHHRYVRSFNTEEDLKRFGGLKDGI